jgi:beta-lactamase class A
MTFFVTDQSLQHQGDRILNETIKKYGIDSDRLAITLLIYDQESIINTATDPATFWSRKIKGYAHRGTELVYPASIVKLFYLVALQEWLDKNMISPSPELERAQHDMIVDSSNDATSLVVDALTGTTSGMELSESPFSTWKYQRQIVNRYFNNLVPDYSYINVCQKTWGDGPYGRERAFYGINMANRNLLTTNASAHLLHSIITGMAISSDRTQIMRSLLQRSLQPEDLAANPENQVTGFLGGGLPQTASLWSKAGLTSKVRHDAAYVEVPNKSAFTLVVFTEDHAKNEEILPFICRKLIEEVITASIP